MRKNIAAMRRQLAGWAGTVGRGLARAGRFLIQDRHDALTWTGITAFTVGVEAEFGRGWAAMAFGAVCLVFAWKGMR